MDPQMSVSTAHPPPPDLTHLDLLDALSGAVALGRKVCIPASGGSMGAAFASARGIVVVPYDSAAVGVGSVIVFQRDGRWIVHRVMGVYGRGEAAGYVTKGDVLTWLDRPRVNAAEVKGVVVGLNMANGTTVDLTSTRWRWRGRARVVRGWLTVALARRRRAPSPARWRPA